MADETTTTMADAMNALLQEATDDDLQRLARVISPSLFLTPAQRRVGFEVIVKDIFSRIGEPEPAAPAP